MRRFNNPVRQALTNAILSGSQIYVNQPALPTPGDIAEFINENAAAAAYLASNARWWFEHAMATQSADLRTTRLLIANLRQKEAAALYAVAIATREGFIGA